MVAETPSVRNSPTVIASEAKQSMVRQRKYGLLRRCAPRNDGPALLPRKHRLFQLSHTCCAARQHFAELIDQRRGRRVDVECAEGNAGHAPRTFPDHAETGRIAL